MWAFIYSGVFIAALIIGVVSKFVQPSWTKDFTAEWSDSVGTVYKDITYGEKDANKSSDEQILKWLCSKGYAEAEKLGYHIDEMSIGGGSAGHCLAMLYAYREA